MLEQNGSVSVSGTASNKDYDDLDAPVEHHKFWNKAMDAALDRAHGAWGDGDFNVVIHSYAKVHVWNPGKIVDYTIVLTKNP